MLLPFGRAALLVVSLLVSFRPRKLLCDGGVTSVILVFSHLTRRSLSYVGASLLAVRVFFDSFWTRKSSLVGGGSLMTLLICHLTRRLLHDVVSE